MFDRIEDTIVAISTPPGKGQRGVVRLSGSRAVEIAAQLFRPDGDLVLCRLQRNVRVRGRAALRAEAFNVPAELFVFRGPRSYTREDVVELHTVAAPALLALIVDRAREFEARPAEPGEFTARAFYHGALDLTAVEGVAALIHARTDVQLRAAREWLDGNLAERLRTIRGRLIELLTLVEAEIDFAEEHIGLLDPAALLTELQSVVRELEELLQHSESGERLDQAPRVLLVGRPNTGKSTLMNRLTGMNRAVCSPVAGTTRDLLTAVAALPDGQIELIDTAGVRNNPQELEAQARNLMLREVVHADLVCHLLDLADPIIREQELDELSGIDAPVMWLGNKCDAATDQAIAAARRYASDRHQAELHVISARRGDGLADLTAALSQALFHGSHLIGTQRVVINSRHRQAVRSALEALRRILERGDVGVIDGVEWTACDMRSAVGELGAIFGELSADEMLREIFARFCIGK